MTALAIVFAVLALALSWAGRATGVRPLKFAALACAAYAVTAGALALWVAARG